MHCRWGPLECADLRFEFSLGKLREERRGCSTANTLICVSPDRKSFMVQVDAVALGIPDYHDIVRQPADLGTIRARLARGATQVCASTTLTTLTRPPQRVKNGLGTKGFWEPQERTPVMRSATCRASAGCTTWGA